MSGAIGQTDITEDEVEGLGQGETEGRLDGGGVRDVVAVGLKETGEDTGGVRVVFNEKDATWGAGGGRRTGRGGVGNSGGRGGDAGKRDGEGGAEAKAGTVGSDVAAVEFGEALADGESEAEAAVIRVALFKGSEEAFEVGRLEAGPLVGDGDADMAGQIVRAGAGDGDATVHGGELDGIGKEIPEYLVNPRGVGIDPARPAGVVECDLLAARGGFAGDDLEDTGE